LQVSQPHDAIEGDQATKNKWTNNYNEYRRSWRIVRV